MDWEELSNAAAIVVCLILLGVFLGIASVLFYVNSWGEVCHLIL